MSVKGTNLTIDIQDGTTGKNRLIVDFDEFSHELYDSNKSNLDISTYLTLGEFLVFREIRRLLIDDNHDVFIKIGCKS